MNENDVIKAIECCLQENPNVCDDCPFNGKEEGCLDTDFKLLAYALDLIKRQQAEIERLQSLCASKDVIINSQEAEIMQNENRFPHFTEDTQVVTVSKKADGQYYADRVTTIQVDKIRAEAIKEFAKRLKDDVANIPAWGSVAAKKIDNLVKEMTEE